MFIASLTVAAALVASQAGPTQAVASRPFTVASSDGYAITGQVDYPEGRRRLRGVTVMVAGTGAFDRDVRLGRSGTPRDKVFADLAQRIAARSMAVVRYDRRGVRHGVPAAEIVDGSVAPTVTADNLSLDLQAVYRWARSRDGLNQSCVVVFAHSEGMVHLAGMARTRVQPPARVIGVGAPLESKLAIVRWQSTGRDADSLLMMDADRDGTITNAEVEANWTRTPSAVFGVKEPFLQPDGAWSPEDIALLRANQTALYDIQKTAALAQPDAAPYPGPQSPAFSYGWWKTWFTDDRPLAEAFVHWSTPMILHYGALDSQVREDRQRAAAEGVLRGGRITFVSHPDRGHTLGDHPLLGPMDAAIADRLADEARGACR